MAVNGNGQDLLRLVLADHVFVQLPRDLARGRNLGEELLAGAPAASLLLQDGLAQLDALAANVDVSGSLDQRANVPVTLPAKRAEGVLLGGTAAAAASSQVPA